MIGQNIRGYNKYHKRVKRYCPGCGVIIPSENIYCDRCYKKRKKEEEEEYNRYKEKQKEKNKERYKIYYEQRKEDLKDKETQEFYSSKDWKAKRKDILIRDNYFCVECKRKYGILKKANIVHHIVELKDDYSKALDDDNLISVCKGCHVDIHVD